MVFSVIKGPNSTPELFLVLLSSTGILFLPCPSSGELIFMSYNKHLGKVPPLNATKGMQ